MSAFTALALLLAAPATRTDPPDREAIYEAVRAADLRLAAIGYRLAVANAPLCDRLQPGLGVVVHAFDQYGAGERDAARRAFGFETPVAIEAVVPGSPADRAGVRSNDSLAAVGDAPITDAGEGIADRDRVLDQLEAGAPDGAVPLTLRHDGVTRTVTVQATPACRVRFELLLGRGFYAGSDGRVVKLGERFFERYADEDIAVIVAHELAHAILRHRERLNTAEVDRGLLKEFGRNGRLFRRTEVEADELGVHLLANAGYDPLAAARFWRTKGGDIDHGVFRARTHPSSKARAEALDKVARGIMDGPRPSIPAALLGTRDQPLDQPGR